MSNWTFVVVPLTPLHIGAGEEIQPFEYVVTDRVYRFDPEDFILSLSPAEQDTFVRLTAANLVETRRFMQQRVEKLVRSATYSFPVSPEALRIYEQRLDNPRSDLSIGLFVRTAGRPFIPGSSLKGALRTALLYAQAQKPIQEQDAGWLEAQTFGYAYTDPSIGLRQRRITNDPFKTVKIGDSPPQEGMTRLAAVWVQTKMQEGGWTTIRADMALLREVSLGEISDGTRLELPMPVILNQELRRYAPRLMDIGKENLVSACREFYGRHLQEEARFHADSPDTAAIYRELQTRQQKLPADACLVRFGWGSGFDAVTVRYGRQGAQPIDQLPPPGARRSARGNEGLLLYTAASRRLVEGGVPMGWAEVQVRAG